MKTLELLAPARNIDIGIAAIDCGADAVYIAGPGFGARKAAGNSLEDIAELCAYAHRFGVRIYLTVNTIVYDGELDQVHRMMLDAQDAGVDAFIVQDLALTGWDDIRVPLHASTQCSIRDARKAQELEALGFGRLVLERELQLKDIRAIAEATGCEIEAFVHGALCVCYSGQCYLSDALTGRSANRGECIQACRSLYDLIDSEGQVLLRDKALLSLKDLSLLDRLRELADAGVCSFKIEGRLKNASYVRNVVRQYSLALDELVAASGEEYRRSSFGTVTKGFIPAQDKTFNRGYTELFFDGRRGRWSSMDAPKSMGEHIGSIDSVKSLNGRTLEIRVRPLRPGLELHNGDGFSIPGKGEIIGFRGDVCEGLTIRCKAVGGIVKGAPLYRNIDASFERELEKTPCRRELRVELSLSVSGDYKLDFTARCEDGRQVQSSFSADLERAENRERAEAMMREQLSKRSGDFIFTLKELEVSTKGDSLPLMSASTLNSIRRLLASDLEALPAGSLPLYKGRRSPDLKIEDADYKANVANAEAKAIIESTGAKVLEPAFELSHRKGAELMRTRYCIKYELGLCSRHPGGGTLLKGRKVSEPLFLLNNGKRLKLGFDCAACEMTVMQAD